MQYLPESKVSLILHGINIDHYCPSLEEKYEDKLKCITVGSWLRDYDCVLEVARLLVSNRYIEFHVVSAVLAERDSTANNVMLEGIACGLPVVASDLPGVKAYVPGDEAILVKDNSREKFASALLGLQQNRKRLADMALCARQRALELSWRKIVPQVESVYSGLLCQ
jgi:glycosyltransferase involved in cell wall biosynthesis